MMDFADDFVLPEAPRSPTTPAEASRTPTKPRRAPLAALSQNVRADDAPTAAAGANKRQIKVKVWEGRDGNSCYLVRTPTAPKDGEHCVAVYKCDHKCGFTGSFQDVAAHEQTCGRAPRAAEVAAPAARDEPTPVAPSAAIPTPRADRACPPPTDADPAEAPSASDRRALALIFALALTSLVGAHSLPSAASAIHPAEHYLAGGGDSSFLPEYADAAFSDREAVEVMDACMALVSSDPPAAYSALRAGGIHGALAQLRRAWHGVLALLKGALFGRRRRPDPRLGRTAERPSVNAPTLP